MGAMTEDSGGKKILFINHQPWCGSTGRRTCPPSLLFLYFSHSVWLLGYSAFSLNPHPSFLRSFSLSLHSCAFSPPLLLLTLLIVAHFLHWKRRRTAITNHSVSWLPGSAGFGPEQCEEDEDSGPIIHAHTHTLLKGHLHRAKCCPLSSHCVNKRKEKSATTTTHNFSVTIYPTGKVKSHSLSY